MAGEFQPQAVLEIGVELGGDEAGLGEELGRALAQEMHLLRLAGIEQYQRFGAPAAVLRASEGEDVDAAFPGHFRRRRAEMR